MKLSTLMSIGLLFGLGADIPNVPYQRGIPASKTRNTGAAKDRRNAKKRRAK